MTVLDAQVGYKKESTYNTAAVPVTSFAEFTSEGVEDSFPRVESDALRVGTFTQREDRFTPYEGGASGPYEFDVMTKGFGFWLEHMLGTVATTGPAETTCYTHTGTVSDLAGKSFTWQVNRPFYTTANQAFTYAGGKVTKWELSNSVGKNLVAKLDLDFASSLTATALATASYPASMENLTFVGGVVTVGGSQFDVTDCSVSMDNKLKVDRRYLKAGAVKKEPMVAGMRPIEWSLKADFDSLTQRTRVISATRAGALASIVLSWTGPTLLGSTIYPKLTVTIPSARFDSWKANVSGSDPLEQELSGVGLTPAAGTTPITLAYISADTTAI